jgi:hypothetical protein
MSHSDLLVGKERNTHFCLAEGEFSNFGAIQCLEKEFCL